MTTAERLMTVAMFEDYLAQPENRDRRLELIDGIVMEKSMPTEEHGYISANLTGFVWQYMRQSGLGRVYVEARYQTPDDRRNSRIPDVSVSLSDEPIRTDGAASRLPEIAAEIASPDDSLADLRARIRYYLDHGTQIGILILPRKRLVEVYRKGHEEILTESDTLILEDILPGFQVAVSDLFLDTKRSVK